MNSSFTRQTESRILAKQFELGEPIAAEIEVFRPFEPDAVCTDVGKRNRNSQIRCD